MRVILLVGVSVLLLVVGGLGYLRYFGEGKTRTTTVSTPLESVERDMQSSGNKGEVVKVVAEGLDTPWAIAFLPNGDFLVTERAGRVRLVTNGKLKEEPVGEVGEVREIGEGGLLGVAIHPEFSNNNFVYFYYTYSESSGETLNRISRTKFENGKLAVEEVILDKIPGASNHNGGRIKFGPDKYLYITTGDAGNPSLSQNKDSLAGKILRVTDLGMSVVGNPFQNLTYTFGHRNSQGIAWDENGELFATEHGPSGIPGGNDEINKIESGKNYGWPDIQGDETRAGMETPIKNSGKLSTWAPGGAAFYKDWLFFAGLRGQSLYRAKIRDGRVEELNEYFKGKYGRIREVVLGPDEALYITTSNNDGRGSPKEGDDKVLRVDPKGL